MLEKERKQIDNMDNEIIELLNKRMGISEQIAERKAKSNLNVDDVRRENQILNNEKINKSVYRDSITRIYEEIFAQSKRLQKKITDNSEIEYALFGKNLFYSISKQVHKWCNDQYKHVECDSLEQVLEYLNQKSFRGANITNPFKEKIIPYLDYIDNSAEEVGSVNVVIKKGNQKIGYNTDIAGFMSILETNLITVANKSFLVLGTGATGKMIKHVLTENGAICVIMLGRNTEINYDNYSEKLKNFEFSFVINATPVGNILNDYSLIDLSNIKLLNGVIDLNYFPFYSKLLMQTKAKNLLAINGFKMLIVQAVESEKLFGYLKEPVNVNQLCNQMYREILNVTFVGMPGAGKTYLAKAFAKMINREFYDTDEIIEKITGMSIDEIFKNFGEKYFRNFENFVFENIIKYKKGVVIATGGGAVENAGNREIIAQNSFVVKTERNISESQSHQILQYYHYDTLLSKRNDEYNKIANIIIKNQGEDIKSILLKIEEEYNRYIDEM